MAACLFLFCVFGVTASVNVEGAAEALGVTSDAELVLLNDDVVVELGMIEDVVLVELGLVDDDVLVELGLIDDDVLVELGLVDDDVLVELGLIDIDVLVEVLVEDEVEGVIIGKEGIAREKDDELIVDDESKELLADEEVLVEDPEAELAVEDKEGVKGKEIGGITKLLMLDDTLTLVTLGVDTDILGVFIDTLEIDGMAILDTLIVDVARDVLDGLLVLLKLKVKLNVREELLVLLGDVRALVDEELLVLLGEARVFVDEELLANPVELALVEELSVIVETLVEDAVINKAAV